MDVILIKSIENSYVPPLFEEKIFNKRVNFDCFIYLFDRKKNASVTHYHFNIVSVFPSKYFCIPIFFNAFTADHIMRLAVTKIQSRLIHSTTCWHWRNLYCNTAVTQKCKIKIQLFFV